MGTAAKTATQATEKREAILEAALDLFVQRGFHGTAVPHIAERAGVGAGTIYRYFENKEALVNALYQRFKREIFERVLADFPLGAPPREQFHVLWSRLSEYVLERPRAFAFLELHHHRSYLDEESRALESQLIDFALGFVTAAQEQQVLKAGEPMLLMTLVYGAFVGLVRASWEGKLDLTPERMSKAEQCVWEAVRN